MAQDPNAPKPDGSLKAALTRPGLLRAIVLTVLLLAVGSLLVSSGVLTNNPFAKKTYGRIYVESPEVYTRQRLVNDRLSQDAWLKEQLDILDDNATSFIGEWSEKRRELQLDLLATAGPSPGESDPGATAEGQDTRANDEAGGDDPSPAPWWSDNPTMPFQAQFELKSAARDKIRQLLLENALDDRHDLRGNTVYGLKFDTAVVPGSNTLLRPTVVVKMRVDPFPNADSTDAESLETALTNLPDKEQKNEKELARLASIERTDAIERAIVLGAAGFRPTAYAQPLERLKMHYESWYENIGVRLNEYIHSSCSQDLMRGGLHVSDELALEVKKIIGDPSYVDLSGDSVKLETVPISAGAAASSLLDHAEQAPGLRTKCLAANLDMSSIKIPETITSAVNHVFGLPEFAVANLENKPEVQAAFQGIVCGSLYPERRLDNTQFVNIGIDLPAPWGDFFFLTLKTDPWKFELSPKGRRMILSELDLRESLTFSRQVRCAVRERGERNRVSTIDCDPTPDDTTEYLYLYELDKKTDTSDFSNSEIAALYNGTTDGIYCSTRLGLRPKVEDCGKGQDEIKARAITFQSGLYEFANSVRGIDTYAYAAFPRGDVSGVISEASSETDASLEGALAPTSFGARLMNSDRSRTARAKPNLLNFAAGEDNGAMFDFGWTIVKEGRKDPMMASQLVLVSVPAYLDTLELEITEGWLDSDVVLADGKTWDKDYSTLDRRIKLLLKEPETIVTTVHLPPDFQALDSLVAPAASRQGPLINLDAMKCDQDGNPATLEPVNIVENTETSIVIPGARLWRSTVVALGSHRDKKIEVMPDMRGIIATFDGIPFVETAGGDQSNNKLDLIVWTSEGRTVVPDFALVVRQTPSPTKVNQDEDP